MNKMKICDCDKEERKRMLQHGFFVHATNIHDKHLINFHTHGLSEMKNHMDFQIVFRIEAEKAYKIFEKISNKVSLGEKFVENTIISNIYETNLKLIKIKEGNRTVLRIILPDPKGYYPEDDKCDLTYAMQNMDL